ncbi:MAG TPA: hypothetical protein VLU99_03765 [Nitrososphaerales archaeon]|nr:hypothetical protein [Nitrososphaerales archaeon]
MPKCPNGHEQALGLKCQACGAPISYRGALSELSNLPQVKPEYGAISMLTVGYPRLSSRAEFVGEIASGPAELRSSTSFHVAGIRGGTWLEFSEKYLKDLRRWMTIVGVDKATDRVLVVDTTDPLSVLALSALPKLQRTMVVAVTADQDCTPVEQNTSYVAVSLALKKGLPIIALSSSFEKEMLFFTEDRGFATGPEAMSRLLEPLLAASEDLMDLLERDLRLGIKLHCISAILAGSKNVYGIATNALMAQTYNFSLGTKPTDYRTVHTLVLASKDSQGEFEKSFGVFRNRKFKDALSAELRFKETPSPLYDMVTIYGMKGDSFLESIAGGYEAIVKSMPELNVDGV